MLHAEKVRIDSGDKPIDNFGAFVKTKVGEGLRGRELAAAIHAEHVARGQGGGPRGEAGPDDEHGRPGDAERPDGERGRPEDAGKPGGAREKPDDGARSGKEN